MKVLIEHINDEFILVDESGQTIESGFFSEDEAGQYANDNGYSLVMSFFI